LAGLIVHGAKVVEGRLRVGARSQVLVDADRRWDIMRNHTATHLLHHELRRVLGDHVLQQGSLVAPDRLRFDFNHPAMVTQDELRTIEGQVSLAIQRNYPVTVGHTSLKDAKGRGAMALFGEKYGDVVRTIQIGDPADPYSLELCGGTHVNGTAEIGSFRIISEGSVGANLRRVEAVTGRRLEVFVGERIQVLDRAAAHLNVSPTEVDDKVLGLLDEVQAARKELAHLQRALARQGFERLMETNVQDAAGLPVLTAVTDGATVATLREMADWFRAKVGSGVAALGTVADDRPLFIVAVTPDLVERGLRAGDLIRPAAKLIGGGGGGKPTLAQAGGRDKSRLQEAVALVPQLVADAVRDGMEMERTGSRSTERPEAHGRT
jgi:alanyl-tRNA synthetase